MGNFVMPEINSELVCVHVINDTKNGSRSQNISPPDIRSNKPFGIHNQKDDQTAFFQKLIKGTVSGREISVASPNEISLALSIATKSISSANVLRGKISKENEEDSFYKEDVKDIYNLLEEMQKAIVFSYRAIESFCNASIPSDYIYRKTNQKGITEEYGKQQIERWVTTSEKVSVILPEILKCESPIKEGFWSGFKKLESIRNEIIHSKSSSSTNILSELFSERCEDYVESSILLLHYFIKLDPTNQIFPLGFGTSKVKVISVPDAESCLKIVNQEDK